MCIFIEVICFSCWLDKSGFKVRRTPGWVHRLLGCWWRLRFIVSLPLFLCLTRLGLGLGTEQHTNSRSRDQSGSRSHVYLIEAYGSSMSGVGIPVTRWTLCVLGSGLISHCSRHGPTRSARMFVRIDIGILRLHRGIRLLQADSAIYCVQRLKVLLFAGTFSEPKQ